MSPAAGSLFACIRSRCAEVARRAQSVAVEPDGLAACAERLATERPEPEDLDPGHQRLGDPESTLAFVLTLNAINFGSGWFPHLRKRAGLSGYRSVASALRERFEREGPFSAAALRSLRARDCARLLGQPLEPPAGELMALYARALADLGRFLDEGYGGRFAGPVEEAGGSAERLVGSLARMPLYRDVARYEELEVPFYKRAQITAADLAVAFEGAGPGRFDDLEALTLFADNLVPHVLRMEGVLRYDPGLEAQIERGDPIAAGAPQEVEIRAVALHAVEGLVAACRARGWVTSAQRLDAVLWTRGQAPHFKAVPRHRTRCSFY